jgi:PhzF family phenazine biosynthesis protein
MKIYQVDAFTNKLFGGNPAAICPLESWISEELMQNIAMENNLSETAFYVPRDNEFELRWFTPRAEIKLCGHATLATSHVIFAIEKSNQETLKFHTLSGVLTVTRAGRGYTMNFPADTFRKTEVTDEMKNVMGVEPELAFFGNDVLMLVLSTEKQLLSISPDPEKVEQLHRHGLIVTAKGEKSDFSSRCFFPHYGINEDPVTGSAHTLLTPYWADRLKKNALSARQLSQRKGELWCTLKGDRVEMSGEAVLYMTGTIELYRSNSQNL